MTKQMQRSGYARFILGATRYFLAFFCSLLLFGFLTLMGIRLTLFRENFMEKQAMQANYYTLLTQEINRQVQDLGLGSNIPEEVLKNVIEEELVARNTKNYFQAVYTGKEFTLIGDAEIRQNIIDHVNSYAQKEGIAVSEESNQAIEKLADETVALYETYIKIPFFLEYGHRLINFRSSLSIFLIITGICLIVINVFLLYLLHKSWHRYFRFVAYYFLGAGLMLLVIPTTILVSGVLTRVNIQSKSLYLFLTGYLNGFLKIFIYFGSLVFILGILLFIVSEVRRKRKLTRAI